MLTTFGCGALAIGGMPTVWGDDHAETRLRDGGVINCWINYDDKFDKIYNDMIDMENSLVLLSHNKWEDDIYLRVGDVYRVSNINAKTKFENGANDGDVLMVAAHWDDDVNNEFFATKGRVNNPRCPNEQSAHKYWFHELGHGHELSHRDEWLGQLMDPHDPEAMHLNQEECDEWNDTYYTSSTTQDADSSAEDQHFECGLSQEALRELDEGDFDRPFSPVQIKKKKPLDR